MTAKSATFPKSPEGCPTPSGRWIRSVHERFATAAEWRVGVVCRKQPFGMNPCRWLSRSHGGQRRRQSAATTADTPMVDEVSLGDRNGWYLCPCKVPRNDEARRGQPWGSRGSMYK